MSARADLSLPQRQAQSCGVAEPLDLVAAMQSLRAMGNEIALLRIKLLRMGMAPLSQKHRDPRPDEAEAAQREEYWRRKGYWVID